MFSGVIYENQPSCYLSGVVLVGTRGAESVEGQPVSGRIAVSRDFGRTWKEYGRVIDGQIVCLAALDSQAVLTSTSTGEIWKSVDQGKSWHKTKQIADVPLYGMLVTDQGTVLVSNYDLKNPGHVYRSTDQGETWSDLGKLSPKGLYRFQKVRDGIILNGMAGHVFKSTDDGLTWKEVTHVEQPLDDFVRVHDGLVYLSAYQGETSVRLPGCGSDVEGSRPSAEWRRAGSCCSVAGYRSTDRTGRHRQWEDYAFQQGTSVKPDSQNASLFTREIRKQKIESVRFPVPDFRAMRGNCNEVRVQSPVVSSN